MSWRAWKQGASSLALVIGAALAAHPASADAPPFLPIQGFLSDADGQPIDGAVGMRFRLYDSANPSGAAEEILHEEQLAQVQVEQGHFTVYLGDAVELPLARSPPTARPPASPTTAVPAIRQAPASTSPAARSAWPRTSTRSPT